MPAAGTPAVNIGIRQKGRLHSPLVIDCGDTTDEIADAIGKALDPSFVAEAVKAPNPYYKADTLKIATDAVLRFAESLPVAPKTFYDI